MMTHATLRLQRNVQFLYEEHIARVELESLGCTEYARDEADWRLVTAHVNGQGPRVHERAAYIGHVGDRPTTYAELIQPAYQGGRFNRTRSVNQYLTHWIYPYRGKFHPQMVRALLNIIGVGRGQLIWEPFLGSGTTALEASLLGIDCIGTDLSPLCVLLTGVKTDSHFELEAIRKRVTALLKKPDLHPDKLLSRKEPNERVRNFLEIARMVTYSDVSRRSRDATPALRKNLAAMLESVEAHARAIADFALQPGSVSARLGDARNAQAAGIEPSSIDGIVTSPPYSIALDYVKNDEHALKAMGTDASALRRVMTGVRGKSAKDKLALYNDDMRQVFGQVMYALRPGAAAAFVVGDATVDGREVTTTDTMIEWAEAAGLRTERVIPKIVFGLYNTMQDERILVFRKPAG